MSFSVIKRPLAILLALLMLTVLLLSSVIQLSEPHRFSCTGNDCLICLVASTLCGLRGLLFGYLACSAAIPAVLFVCEAVRCPADSHRAITLIALKTKILS